MKTILINKEGLSWVFPGVGLARPHLRKEAEFVDVKTEDGLVRVYDDRDLDWAEKLIAAEKAVRGIK